MTDPVMQQMERNLADLCYFGLLDVAGCVEATGELTFTLTPLGITYAAVAHAFLEAGAVDLGS